MAYVVLGAWLVQGSVGIALLVRWARTGRPSAVTVFTHVVLGLAGLALWTVFLMSSNVVPAWLAFGLITVGNGFGDVMLVRRWRRMSGTTSGFWSDYGKTVGAAFRGELPKPVLFHSLFSGVVYFSCLAACIGATVA